MLSSKPRKGTFSSCIFIFTIYKTDEPLYDIILQEKLKDNITVFKNLGYVPKKLIKKVENYYAFWIWLLKRFDNVLFNTITLSNT